MDLQGSLVALVTPFKDDKVDEESLRRHIEWLIEEGADGLVPTGTTGESATLSHEEHERVIELTVEVAAGRVPVVAGTGSNNTAEAIRLTRHAKQAGAAGALLICPYYNKPTQEGLYRHYKAVAEAADFPVIVYNIPGRTSVNMLPETVARLADTPQVVGLKEATGNMDYASELISLTGDRFAVLSGDDSLTLPLMALGAKGVISAAANLAPRAMSDLAHRCLDGDYTSAQAIHYKLLPLIKACFVETNPTPIKTALGLMGRMSPAVRPPLAELAPASLEKLKAALGRAGLLGETA